MKVQNINFETMGSVKRILKIDKELIIKKIGKINKNKLNQIIDKILYIIK